MPHASRLLASLSHSSYICTIKLTMGRIVGIDYGRKRTGLAVTDPLQMFASPLETVRTHDLLAFLTDYDKKEKIESFVIGDPVTMNNLPSESVKYIGPFVKQLEKSFPGKSLFRVDERFTSGMALQTMIEGGVKKSRRSEKGMADKISAAIILQSYLDRRRLTAGHPESAEGS